MELKDPQWEIVAPMLSSGLSGPGLEVRLRLSCSNNNAHTPPVRVRVGT